MTSRIVDVCIGQCPIGCGYFYANHYRCIIRKVIGNYNRIAQYRCNYLNAEYTVNECFKCVTIGIGINHTGNRNGCLTGWEITQVQCAKSIHNYISSGGFRQSENSLAKVTFISIANDCISGMYERNSLPVSASLKLK